MVSPTESLGRIRSHVRSQHESRRRRICALLFRGGLLMYIFGITVVTKNGSRASRLRTFWRSLVTWSPCVLAPMLIKFLAAGGLATTWSLYIVMAVLSILTRRKRKSPRRRPLCNRFSTRFRMDCPA